MLRRRQVSQALAIPPGLQWATMTMMDSRTYTLLAMAAALSITTTVTRAGEIAFITGLSRSDRIHSGRWNFIRCAVIGFGWICILCVLATLIPAGFSAQDATTARLQVAAQSLTAGNLRLAENELQSVLGSSPEDHRALDLLGVVRILEHRDADAETFFRRAIQSDPKFASAHAHLGLLLFQTGRIQQALPELRDAVRLDSSRIDASAALVKIWSDQAQAAVNAGDSEKAFALLIDARNIAPNNSDVQFALGMLALRMSRFQDAIAAFKETLSLRKTDPPALYGLGQAFMALSRYEEARQEFTRYLAQRPNDSAALCLLGITLTALERPAEARTQFEKSIAITPDQTESYFRLGLLDLDSKGFEFAAKNFHHVLDREPRHSGALVSLGRVEFEQKHYAEAADLLQRAISNDDSLREAHYYLGLTYARMGRKPQSDQELQRASQLNQQQAEKQRVTFGLSSKPQPTGPKPNSQ
jgi:tetratricopeptide (TPR) repeat protein